MRRDHEDYWRALERGDRGLALAAIKRLRVEHGTSLDLIRDVILPAQARVEELWESGAWSLEQERAASAVNEGLVYWLRSFAHAPDADRPLVLVSCLQGEDRALSALVLAEGLDGAGFRVSYSGGSPDPEQLLRRVHTLRPRAVLFSGSSTSSLARQLDLFAAITALGIPVVVGGPAFAGDERRVSALGATAYAADVDAAIELLETLPQRIPTRKHALPSRAEVEARWILGYAPQITPYVVRALLAGVGDTPRDWWEELTAHVDHVLGCVAAALLTGDETIMVEVAQWLERVLVARGADPGAAQRIWALVAEPLRGLPLARVHLAAAALAVRARDDRLDASA